METQDEKWGLFWCHLLHPIIFCEIEKKEEHAYMRELSTQEIVFPDNTRKKPSLSTLKRKLKEFRANGLIGLRRQPRSDRGKSRAAEREVIDKAIELKKEQPLRSSMAINMFIEDMYGKTLKKSTLYRHLKEAGATRRKLGIEKTKVRKRWTRENTHDLWVGDVSDGPQVITPDGRSQKTYLSLFIDCHSRYVVEGRYYLSSKFDMLIDTLLRAWTTHGKSSAIYVDNGKIYHANALKAACYDLGIKLIHASPNDPPPKGLVERIFSTAQMQFQAEVRAGDILSVEKLNRAFSAYLTVCYHQTIHSETGQTPKERYEKGVTVIRNVNMQRAIEFFMQKERRTVHPDFSDVQLSGLFFRVDPKFRGDRVEVRFDPYGEKDQVLIYSLQGQYLGVGQVHQRTEAAKVEVSPTGKPKHNFIEMVIDRHERQTSDLQAGIDYRKALSPRWSLASFVACFAYLLGRKGGASAFSSEEQQALRNIYNRYPFLNEPLLRRAFQDAQEPTIQQIAYQLEKISQTKE